MLIVSTYMKEAVDKGATSIGLECCSLFEDNSTFFESQAVFDAALGHTMLMIGAPCPEALGIFNVEHHDEEVVSKKKLD
jgi:hypothetical protein